MNNYFSSHIGRLRLLAFLEGSSFILLFFIAMPLKRIWEMPQASHIIGPIHGGLFLLFVALTLFVAMQQKWGLGQTTWKVLLSSLLPFGTFYIDHKILKPIHEEEIQA